MNRDRILSKEEIERARQRWLFFAYKFGAADEKLKNLSLQKFPQERGWIISAREALFMSSEAVAKRSAISRQTFSRMERGELKGAVTLKTINKIAQAMDCDFVYGFVPKSKDRFSDYIWEELLEGSRSHRVLTKCRPHMRAIVLASVAKKRMQDAKFRRQKGWVPLRGARSW